MHTEFTGCCITIIKSGIQLRNYVNRYLTTRVNLVSRPIGVSSLRAVADFVISTEWILQAGKRPAINIS